MTRTYIWRLAVVVPAVLVAVGAALLGAAAIQESLWTPLTDEERAATIAGDSCYSTTWVDCTPETEEMCAVGNYCDANQKCIKPFVVVKTSNGYENTKDALYYETGKDNIEAYEHQCGTTIICNLNGDCLFRADNNRWVCQWPGNTGQYWKVSNTPVGNDCQGTEWY